MSIFGRKRGLFFGSRTPDLLDHNGVPFTYLDADSSLTANSDAKIATQKAVKSFVASQVASAVTGIFNDRGNFNASVNTFPAAGGSGTAGAIKKGNIWTISVAGTLGGVAVEIGDLVRALVDTPGQTAGNWAITERNFGFVPENVVNKDTDGTLAANSDSRYPSQKAVKTYVDTKIAGVGSSYSKYVAILDQPGDTSAPVATILENSLSGPIVWARNNVGIYEGTLTGAFTTNKTFISFAINNIVNDEAVLSIKPVGVNKILVSVFNSVGGFNEGCNLSLEVRVYP